MAQPNCDYCPLFIALFLCRAASGIFFAVQFNQIFMVACGPIALILSIMLGCYHGGSEKQLKGSNGLIYIVAAAVYYGFWVAGFMSLLKLVNKGYEMEYGTVSGWYIIIASFLIVDMYLLRKFFMKIGRKYFIGSAIKEEFKKIKRCKKQMKITEAKLAILEMQRSKCYTKAEEEANDNMRMMLERQLI